TADGGERTVPCPDGDRKIEGGDDADNAQRMPLFHHAMVRTFRDNGQPVELTRQTNRKVADVDHLLHFALAFSNDFSGFERDEEAEVFFGVAQRVAQLPDDFSAYWRRQQFPFFESTLSAFHRALVFGGRCGA